MRRACTLRLSASLLPTTLLTPGRCWSSTTPYPFAKYGSAAPEVLDLERLQINEPTEKQLQYAESLAAEMGAEMPDDAQRDRRACSAFIDECLRDLPPTDKQIAYAKVLAEMHSVDIPAEVRSNRVAVSAFIEKLVSPAPASPATGSGFDGTLSQEQLPYTHTQPTHKQLAYAQALAERHGVQLPAEVASSRAAASAFIERYVNPASASMPSQEQLLLSAELARTHGLGLEARVLLDQEECRRFIETLLANPMAAE